MIKFQNIKLYPGAPQNVESKYAFVVLNIDAGINCEIFSINDLTTDGVEEQDVDTDWPERDK